MGGGRVIDRAAREEMRSALIGLLLGRLSPVEFELRVDSSSRDHAIWELLEAGIAPLYDDTSDSALEIAPEFRPHLERCIAFLGTDLEYTWPRVTGSLAAVFRSFFWRPWCSPTFERWPFPEDHDVQEIARLVSARRDR